MNEKSPTRADAVPICVSQKMGDKRPIVHFGVDVDEYLNGHGAVAQAIDPDTFLVSSQVWEMTTEDRRLIFLHELAHLHQLATPGDDPVEELEAEAWGAAHAWLRGLSYTVHGRGRAPLNAAAIIQGGHAGHPFAPNWYRSSPAEPIGNKGATINVKSSVLLDEISLEAVMDNIISAGDKEIIVVSHGWNEGLAFPTHKGAAAGTMRAVMFALAADKRGEDVAPDGSKMVTPIKSNKDVADLMHTREEVVQRLRAKMNQVRALSLQHVAFRACNLGSSSDSMQAFFKFFGAASISAPVLEDTYGIFKPTFGKDLDGWTKVMRKSGFHVFRDGQVVVGTKRTGGIVYAIKAHAVSEATFRAWREKHIVAGIITSDGVIFHGMKVDDPALAADDPSIFFIRDQDFISRIVYYAG